MSASPSNGINIDCDDDDETEKMVGVVHSAA